jgi:hypothetical protein
MNELRPGTRSPEVRRLQQLLIPLARGQLIDAVSISRRPPEVADRAIPG